MRCCLYGVVHHCPASENQWTTFCCSISALFVAVQAQTANLTAASLLHAVTPCSAVTPCQPLLFKAQVMMDSLQQTMPPITATVVACTGFDLVSAMSSQANNFCELVMCMQMISLAVLQVVLVLLVTRCTCSANTCLATKHY